MLTDQPGKTGLVSACVYLLPMAWRIFYYVIVHFDRKM